MTSARRSLAYSFLDRYAALVVGVVSTMILARLLTPGELGAFAVAMAMLSLASTLRDLGAGNYLLQEKELTTDRIRAVWAVQLGLGVILAVIVAVAAPLAARFYRDPSLLAIMLLLAVNYLVNPFGSITYAWLMREMRYDAVAVMRFCSTLAGALVSIGLAWGGHGAISLAWGSLCTTSTNAAISILYRPAGYPWLPGVRELGRVLSFGARLTMTSVMNTIAAAAPEFLLGRHQGLAAVGFFSRANGLVALFNRLVTDAVYVVALSLFSQQARDGADFRAPFLRAVAYLTALSWSFSAALMLLAHPTIHLLYGAQWLPAVPLTRWLAAAGALLSVVPLCTAAMVGRGQVTRVAWATLWTAVPTVIAALIGSAWGLQALGAALLGAAVAGLAAWTALTHRCVGFAGADLARAARSSAGVAAAASLGPALAGILFGLEPANPWPSLLLGGLGCTLGFLGGVAVTRHPLRDELERIWFVVRARAAQANRN